MVMSRRVADMLSLKPSWSPFVRTLLWFCFFISELTLFCFFNSSRDAQVRKYQVLYLDTRWGCKLLLFTALLRAPHERKYPSSRWWLLSFPDRILPHRWPHDLVYCIWDPGDWGHRQEEEHLNQDVHSFSHLPIPGPEQYAILNEGRFFWGKNWMLPHIFSRCWIFSQSGEEWRTLHGLWRLQTYACATWTASFQAFVKEGYGFMACPL